MTRPLLILDVQHAGQPGSRSRDLGAAIDLDGDGVVSTDEAEARLTPVYGDAAEHVMARHGVDVLWLRSGTYDERHERAGHAAAMRGHAPCLYVALHLNSAESIGRSSGYSLAIYDERSSGGQLAAEFLSQRWSAARQELHAQQLPRSRVRALKRGDRGWVCIDGIFAGPANLSGVLAEPMFLQELEGLSEEARKRQLRVYGEALGQAAIDWFRARGWRTAEAAWTNC